MSWDVGLVSPQFLCFDNFLRGSKTGFIQFLKIFPLRISHFHRPYLISLNSLLFFIIICPLWSVCRFLFSIPNRPMKMAISQPTCKEWSYALGLAGWEEQVFCSGLGAWTTTAPDDEWWLLTFLINVVSNTISARAKWYLMIKNNRNRSSAERLLASWLLNAAFRQQANRWGIGKKKTKRGEAIGFYCTFSCGKACLKWVSHRLFEILRGRYVSVKKRSSSSWILFSWAGINGFTSEERCDHWSEIFCL